MFLLKNLPNGSPCVETLSHQSPLPMPKKPVSLINNIRAWIILRWWAIQIMLLSTFTMYILTRLDLTVKLSTRPQLILKWRLMTDSLNQSLLSILSLQSLAKITLMTFIMYGAWVSIRLTATMLSTMSVQMKQNYFFLFLLTGITLLTVPM